MDNFQINTSLSDQFPINSTRYSRLGNPVQFDITFEGGNYFVYNDDGTLSRKRYNSFLLPVTSLTEIRQGSNRTTILNVTEQYLEAPWIIDIRGVIINDPERNDYPKAHDQKRQLMLWKKIADTIRVSGQDFNDLDISEIEIDDIVFGKYVGKPDQIPFAIRAISHKPFELRQNTNNG